MILLEDKKLILLFLSLVMILNVVLVAKENEVTDQAALQGPPDIFSLGAGMILTEEPYKGVGTKVRGFPFFLYRTKKFAIQGTTLNYLLCKGKDWELDITGKLRFEGYEEDDSHFLNGMDDRDWTMEMGGSLSKTFSIGKVTTNATADILNEHKGYEFELSYSYDFENIFKIPSLTMSPDIGFSYRSNRLNDYYYGVRSSEALPNRPQYNVGDSLGLTAGVQFNYMLTNRITIVGITAFEWLGDEIRSSPIVEEKYLQAFILGIMYRF